MSHGALNKVLVKRMDVYEDISLLCFCIYASTMHCLVPTTTRCTFLLLHTDSLSAYQDCMSTLFGRERELSTEGQIIEFVNEIAVKVTSYRVMSDWGRQSVAWKSH